MWIWGKLKIPRGTITGIGCLLCPRAFTFPMSPTICLPLKDVLHFMDGILGAADRALSREVNGGVALPATVPGSRPRGCPTIAS